MNNAMQYQNDLSTLNNDFTSIHDRYAAKVAGLKNTGIINRASDLAKQSADLVQKGTEIGHSVEGALGSVGAKHLVDQVIKPGVQRIVKSIGSRFAGGSSAPEPPVVRPTAKPSGGSNTGEGSESGGGQELQPTNTARNPDGSVNRSRTNVESKNNDEFDDEDDVDPVEPDVPTPTPASSILKTTAKLGEDGLPIEEEVATDVAAADWWNPVGWGAALLAVGGGIYSAVEAVESGKKAAEAGVQAAKDMNVPIPPMPNIAGSYIAPVLNQYT